MRQVFKLKRRCPICGEKYGSNIYHISMKVSDNLPITANYDVVCCSNCGFIFADIDDTQENYNKYYSEYNVYSLISKLKENSYEKLSKQRVDFLERYIKKNESIVDIGCGGGNLLIGLKKKGYSNLYGLDPSLESIKYLKKYEIGGRIGNIFDEVPEELMGKFDVVCCTAVLEHIYDLNSAIQKVSSYMKPENGKLYIDVPAIEGFEKYKESLPNYFNQEHINYFSVQSIDNLMGNNGLKRVSDKSDSYYLFETENIIPELIIRVIYEFSEGEKNKYEIVKDIESVESVKRYFEYATVENEKRKKTIKWVISQKKKVIIWGTGAFTQYILQNDPEIMDAVICFIDNNIEKQGKKLCGKIIYSSEYLSHGSALEDEELLVLICSMQNGKEIAKQIEEININQKYLILK